MVTHPPVETPQPPLTPSEIPIFITPPATHPKIGPGSPSRISFPVLPVNFGPLAWSLGTSPSLTTI